MATNSMSKRVGILGSGDVAKSLGAGLIRHGYEVKLSSRTPTNAKLKEWVASTKGKGTVGSFAEAAKFGDWIVVATNGMGTEAAIDQAGPASLADKIVVDATNPLDFSKGMPPSNFTGPNDSLGERIQRKVPKAKVVKCFNTVTHAKMVDPKFDKGTPPMMICGNDEAAKKQVDALLREVGWPGALDVGGIDGARHLEAIVPLWVRVGAKLNTWGHMLAPVT